MSGTMIGDSKPRRLLEQPRGVESTWMRGGLMAKPTCSVDGCEREVFGRGWCNMHYQRVRKTGHVGDVATVRQRGRVCSVNGCDRKSSAKGMCQMHYSRVYKGQDVGTADTVRYKGLCTSGVCDRPAKAKKLCAAHYEQMLSGGPFKPLRRHNVSDCTVRDEAGNKQCSGCLSWLPEDEFSLNASARDGRVAYCSRCRKDIALRAAHNIGIDQYEQLLLIQGGACAICRKECSSGRMLAVDHDHTCCSGKKGCGGCVRGLLCGNCNQGLGKFFDAPEHLRAAADYLERPRD